MIGTDSFLPSGVLKLKRAKGHDALLAVGFSIGRTGSAAIASAGCFVFVCAEALVIDCVGCFGVVSVGCFAISRVGSRVITESCFFVTLCVVAVCVDLLVITCTMSSTGF